MPKSKQSEASNDEIWKYYLLELSPDPQSKEKLADQLKVDEVTWRTYLLTSLKQLHGVFGAAIDTDIIQFHDNQSIVRIQKEDELTFKSAVLAFITDLSIFGHQDVRASIKLKEVDEKYELELDSDDDLQIID